MTGRGRVRRRVESCRDGGVKDQDDAVGTVVADAVDAERPVGTVMVSWASGLAAWAGPAGAAVRAGTATARWAPTALAGTAPAAATAELCSACRGAGRPGWPKWSGTGPPACPCA